MRRAQRRASPGKRERRLLTLSAFTGIGGLDLGLEHAGFKSIGTIEFDDVARSSMSKNRPTWPILEPNDILELANLLTPEALGLHPGELAVLAGGPPCQPFSKAAQWSKNGVAGMADARSSCIGAFMELARRFLPQVILIENVQGFVQGRRSAVPHLESALKKINDECGTAYQLQPRVLNAADYGVPQRRQRAIVVAFKGGELMDWPDPTHDGRPVRAWDAIGKISPRQIPEMGGQYARLLPSVPEGKNYQHFTERGAAKRKLFGYRRRYWTFLLKLAKHEPAWTLAAHPGPSTGPFHWENRPLAAEELLRLQTFPRSWQVLGSYAEQVRQIGNATPPLLAEVVGRKIGEQIFGLKYDKPPELMIRRRRNVPPAARPRPVPKPYHDLDGVHKAHPGTGKGPGASIQMAGSKK